MTSIHVTCSRRADIPGPIELWTWWTIDFRCGSRGPRSIYLVNQSRQYPDLFLETLKLAFGDRLIKI